MMHSRKFLFIATALGVGFSGALYRAVRSSAQPAAPARGATLQPAAGPESSDLAQLRQEVLLLRHQVRSHEQRFATSPDVPVAAASAEPPGPYERAEEARRHQEYVAGIAAAFRKEARDPRWSAETSSVIQTALVANQELKPLAGSVECRSRTCRVEVTDDGTGVLGKQLPMLAQQVGQSLPSMTADRVEDGTGRATMVLYFSSRLE